MHADMMTIENLIFDMDGVLWLGATPIMPLADLFGRLDALGINYVLATNNASRTVDQYVDKLHKLGVEMAAWRILSSAETTGAYLADQFPAGSRAYVLGSDGLHFALQSRGFDVLELPKSESIFDGLALLDQAGTVDVVVVGFTPHATYADFAAATHFVNRGARFIGSNPDLTFPTEIGRLPGAGSLIGLVANATGVTPTIIGKPYPYIYEEALKRLGGDRATTAMVGDRLNTDIEGAINVGIRSILVMSGITTAAELAASAVQPDYVTDNVTTLLQQLETAKQKV